MGGQRVRGLPASPGVAVGPAWWYRRGELRITRHHGESPEVERARLRQAREDSAAELDALIAARRGRLRPEELAIFEAQRLMLDDPDLLARVEEAIEGGASAEAAWEEGIEAVAAQLRALPDPYFQARAADVEDVGRRVLRRLLGVSETLELPEQQVVVLAEDLTPSDTATLDQARVLALVTSGGGPTSHAAILARRLGIPAVVGVGAALGGVAEGTILVVDGDTGDLIVSPSIEERAGAQIRRQVWLAERMAAGEAAAEPAVTRDGHRVEIAANVGSLEDARAAVRLGAEGVGLLRTEFLYLDRATAPDEEEQLAAYRPLLEALEGRPVVVRTFDAGGDKPLPYLPLEPQPNPFLGVRAIRLARRHPELLRIQLRAILRTGYPAVRVMFPMVATVEEIRWLRQVFEEVKRELEAAGAELPRDLQAGMMVEIPSAAVLADRFAPWVDFFSIGTNDLAQYTLAADRTNPAVAELADAFHPAVLRLMRMVVEAGHAAGRWVGVCGELAGEPLAAPLLVGLGVDELSMAPVAIPAVKAAIRRWTLTEARSLAEQALGQDSASAVRDLVRAAGGPAAPRESTG